MKEKKSPSLIILIFLGLVIILAVLLAYSMYITSFSETATNKEKLSNNENQNLINTNSVEIENTISNETVEDNQHEIEKTSVFNQEEYDSSKLDLLFLKTENQKENKIYSPLSIKYALAMLKDAANGESKAQIENLLGNQKPSVYTSSSNMSLANAFFIRDSFKDNVKQEYVNLLKNNYDAEVRYDTFANADPINNWISEKTFKIIPSITDDETVKELDYALINAVAIDMEWENKFLLGRGCSGAYPSTEYFHEKRYFDPDTSWEEKVKKGINVHDPENVTNNIFNKEEDKIEVSGMQISATINNYDIIKELGEENIKRIVSEEYRKFQKGEPYDTNHAMGDFGLYDDETTDEGIQKALDKFLPTYISEISKNYHKAGSSTDFSIYTDEEVKVFAKDLKEYNNTTLQYIGIMPISEDLDKFVENIEIEKINNYISNLKDVQNYKDFKEGVATRIIGYIPKFKFEYDLDLMEDLKLSNVTDVFDVNEADLTNLTDAPSYISTALHKANIEFTQDGIKAAAATFIGGAGGGDPFDYYFDVPVEEIDLTFDKPYMFLIIDKETKEPFFVGTVYEPLLWEEESENPDSPNYVSIW